MRREQMVRSADPAVQQSCGKRRFGRKNGTQRVEVVTAIIHQPRIALDSPAM